MSKPNPELYSDGWMESETVKQILTEHLDEKDYEIYRALKEDGRISDTELGERVGLSRTAAARRREILEEEGIIEVLAVLVLQAADLAYADVRVAFTPSASRTQLDAFIEDLLYEEEIYEIDEYIGGEYDLLLRVWSGSMQHINEYVRDRLQADGVVDHYELQPVSKTRKAWHKIITT